MSITYAAKTQATLTLCVGESDEIAVRVLRVLTRPGREVGLWVPGGRIFGVIGNGNIVHLEPSDAGRDVVGQPIPEAVFKVVADAPGQTEIEFVIQNTGEEASVGSGWPLSEATVRVEVNDCYEAHTSALAQIFNDKDMGGLNKPFLLAGFTPNTHGLTTDTQVMFFMPNPQDRLHGGFAWVDLVTAYMGNLQGNCISFFSGRYDVVPDAVNLLNLPRSMGYDTPSSVVDVTAFYREQLPSQGWTIDEDPLDGEGGSLTRFAKGNDVLNVVVNTGEDGTRVDILLTTA